MDEMQILYYEEAIRGIPYPNKDGKVLHDINQCTNIYHKLDPKDDEDT